MKRIYTISPDGRLSLHLHRGQSLAWDSTARFTFVVAGTQSGKTTFGPWWLWREMQKHGPGDYLAVTSTYDLFKLKMLPALEDTFCRTLKWGRYHAGDMVITNHRDPEWRIILRSASSEAGLESATAKAAWLDECGMDQFRLEAWLATQRRLSLHEGRVLGTTTPYNLGWIYTDVFKRFKSGDPDYNVIQFASPDNPVFPLREYRRAERTLPGWRFQMMYQGLLIKPAGLIYRDFDDDRHVLRPFTIPAHWPRLVGVDPGGPVHTAVVWLAEVPETGWSDGLSEEQQAAIPAQARVAGNLFLYREILGGDLTAPQQARACLEYADPVRMWLGGAKSEDAQRLDWQLGGAPVAAPWITDVEAQIDRVVGFFKTDRLFVFETCSGVRAELGTYSRELDDAGEPTVKIADKERFHRLDALRYICSGVALERPEVLIEHHTPWDTREVGSLADIMPSLDEREADYAAT